MKTAFFKKKNSVEVMNTSITGEIEQIFHINLQGYRKTSLDAVIEASKTDPSELSLIELVNKSCSRDCIGEPVTYVNSNNGYIFYKESNGTNVAITVKKKDTWVIVKKSVQDGIYHPKKSTHRTLFIINTLPLHAYNGISLLFYNDIFHTHTSVSLCNNTRENHCAYIYISQTLNHPKIYYNLENVHNDKYFS